MSAPTEQVRLQRLIDRYDGRPVCPRCSNGYPICTDGFTHQATCAKYVWSDDCCAMCEAEMAAQDAASDSAAGGVA